MKKRVMLLVLGLGLLCPGCISAAALFSSKSVEEARQEQKADEETTSGNAYMLGALGDVTVVFFARVPFHDWVWGDTTEAQIDRGVLSGLLFAVADYYLAGILNPSEETGPAPVAPVQTAPPAEPAEKPDNKPPMPEEREK